MVFLMWPLWFFLWFFMAFGLLQPLDIAFLSKLQCDIHYGYLKLMYGNIEQLQGPESNIFLTILVMELQDCVNCI